MNNVTLIGRMTRDPELRWNNDLAIVRFTVAINRMKEGADFIPVVAFGKRAETIEKYFHKGSQIGVQGRLQTGSYKDKDGNTRYTTDVILENFDFLDKKTDAPTQEHEGFEAINDDDIPF